MITILLALITLAGLPVQARGLVTGVTVAPRTVQTGQQISITVTGRNPCGAAHLVTGDGAAVTHAIVDLPTTHAHSYRKPGTYTITARGMGNCDGEAVTTVEVTGRSLDETPPPAPPAPPASEITEVEISPRPGRVRVPVTFTISGRGTCQLAVEFGDGNSRQIHAGLPQQVSHAYAVANRYTVVVRPVAPCRGRFTEVVDVLDTEPAGQLARVSISPAPASTSQPVTIRVEGSGRCAYSLDYGDGNSEPRDAALPDRVTHRYNAPGMFTVSAAAQPPCRGTDRVTFEVRGAEGPSNLTAVEVSPTRPFPGEQVTLTVRGSGQCRVGIDFGDGNRRTHVGQLPLRVFHVFESPGRYSVEAVAEAPCGGTARVPVDVSTRRR